jgi:hypothetical protein
MAKKPSQELARIEEDTSNLPDYLRDVGTTTGLEHFDRDDFKIPRLKLLQALNPEIKDFPGVAMPGNFWVSSAKVSLGNEVEFVICVAKRRVLLWSPKSANNAGGLLATSNDGVHWDNPNQSFEVTLKNVGKVTWSTRDSVAQSGLLEWGSSNPKDPKSAPAATLTYEYLAYLLPDGDLSPVVFSLHRTGVNTAKDLNTMLASLRKPMQAVRVIANARDEQGAEGDFYMWNFRLGGYVSAQQYAQAMEITKRFSEFEAEPMETGETVDLSNVSEF